ncbi:MAG: 2Fe-2S iron-sulfur cluster-binding protein [Thermodesulfobacteriota bacterium]
MGKGEKKIMTGGKKQRPAPLKSRARKAKARKEVIAPKDTVQQVTLKINRETVKARQGMTILEAARGAGIFIPTLCHHDELSPYGVCRLCIVEILRGQRSRIVASCLYPVEDGLEVLTESERVVRHRKVILELILARWPWVDEDLLERYGVERGRLEENTTFCILCGLCVRYCSEIKKANVLGFIGRGAERQVVIYPELAMKVCPTCGDGTMECNSVCPTGIIPNEFALSAPCLGKKLPLAYAVRLYEDDNIRDILHKVGD